MRACLLLLLACEHSTGAIVPRCDDCPQQTADAPPPIEITSVSADLAAGQLRVTGFFFGTDMTSALDDQPLQVLAVTPTSATLAATALPEGRHTLTLANATSSATRAVTFVKGDRGPRGFATAPAGKYTPNGAAISIRQRAASADALRVDGAVAITGYVVPALTVQNTSTGLGLLAHGQLDFSAAAFRVPLYMTLMGDVDNGGLGTPTSTPNDYPDDLRVSEAVPGVAYCRAGDLPVGGGCVATPNSCGISASEPVTEPLTTGHLGWKCRAIDKDTRTSASCAVTAQALCLKVHR